MFCLKKQYIFLLSVMDIYSILLISITISMILYYIYETNVLWEYLNKISDLLNFNASKKIFCGILLVKAYPSSQESNYLQFINKMYNTFTTRLLSCPICLGFWMCLIAGALSHIILVPIFAFISLTMYYFIKILTKLSAKI